MLLEMGEIHYPEHALYNLFVQQAIVSTAKSHFRIALEALVK
jgi:hypothetical protein